MGTVYKSEHLWLTWDDLTYLSAVADDIATDRKKRLFGCACARLVWRHLAVPAAWRLVEVAEAFADHEANREQVRAARRVLDGVIGELQLRVAKEVWLATPPPPWFSAPDDVAEWTEAGVLRQPEVAAARQLSQVVGVTGGLERASLAGLAWPSTHPGDYQDGGVARCAILRDLFGNPFRPVAFDPGWRTDTAVSLARGMYEGRDFAATPILADALQDAGCENDDVLSHCRDPHVTHVRGCWVVDLVLGKA